MLSLSKTKESFRHALRGLHTIWSEEHNFRTEIILVVVACIFGGLFSFSYVEWAIIFLSCGAMLFAEGVNTALEDLCNRVEPAYDPLIGKVKDISAAAVLIASIFSALAVLAVLIRHFIG